MKRLIAFSILCLLSGCATRKASTSVEQYATEQSELHARREQGSQRQETTSRATDAEMTSSLRESLLAMLSENLRVNAIFYDTDKPADSATGKPPVQAEITLQRDRNNTLRQERDADAQASERSVSEKQVVQADSLKTDLTASTDRQEAMKADEKTKTTRRVPWWVWVVGIGIVAGGLCMKSMKLF